MDDPELMRIALREAEARVAGMLHALRAPGHDPWDEVYRHAHTLAGIAGNFPRDRVSELARGVAGLLRDPFGRPVRLTAEDQAAVRSGVDEIAEELRRLGGRVD